MIVKVYAVNQDTGEQTFMHHSRLADCFPDDASRAEYYRAAMEIERSGRYWAGGGASALFLLMRQPHP